LSLANNIEFLRHLPKMPKIDGLDVSAWGFGKDGKDSPLTETTGFGGNPGDLKMYSYVPGDLGPNAPLVVVLHGCTQKAVGYDVGAGWSKLAHRYGFALMMPEQTSSNNGNTCFNWFDPQDVTRDSGEVMSIREMIARMVDDHRLDRKRVFVTGLSAGGAMTSAMLATYPEVFAAGAVIAGLPYGVAGNVQQALGAMYRPTPRPAEELGDLVRNASPHRGPWPKLSVWHGSADRTVNPANADEIVKQWLDVHQLPQAPMSEGFVDGQARQVWWNAAGETMIESYTIADMAHGTPLSVAGPDDNYGAEGPFMLEAGISSSWHIANFFGLTDRIHQPQTVTPAVQPAVPVRAPVPAQMPDDAVANAGVFQARAAGDRRAPPRDSTGRRAIDISAVITRALTAAGLMK
jgi:poly(hydroxyalkanoate) depolymerase family esterase